MMTETPLKMSPIVPGLMRLLHWGLDRDDLIAWINACLDMEINTFDHADIYGGYACEAAFGQALAASPSLRDRLVLVTKCGIGLIHPNRPDHIVKHYNTSKAHILASVERSLKNLHTDRIDLLLIHRPDPLMDADEVAAAFRELQTSGKVRYFGVSNFLPFHWDLLQSRLDFPLITNQIEFSLVHLDPFYDGTLDQAQRLRARPMIWSPLGGGHLFHAQDDRSVRVRHKLQQIADEIGGVEIDEVALAWVMAHPSHPIPVIGSGQLSRIKAAVDATRLTLSRQQWFQIWEASRGNEVP
ncbi:MAG: aldo/keto reductase [Anaerolineae bacterium]|jgi:predicted oxidoreductase|nr:aldo/keto reductase [Anaerolineae bacterium]